MRLVFKTHTMLSPYMQLWFPLSMTRFNRSINLLLLFASLYTTPPIWDPERLISQRISGVLLQKRLPYMGWRVAVKATQALSHTL